MFMFTGHTFAVDHNIIDGSTLNLTTGLLTKSDSSTETLTINDGDVINISGTVTITGSKNVHLSCGKDVHLTLDNVTINNGNTAFGECLNAISFGGDSSNDTSTLTLIGDTNLTGYNGTHVSGVGSGAGILIYGIELIIDSSSGGSLNLNGGTGAPGIKFIGNDSIKLTINGGNITATGGYKGLGIGAKLSHGFNTINVNGGKVFLAGNDIDDIDPDMNFSISGDSVVFLKNNTCPVPTTEHTLFSYETIVGNSAYGYTNLPASWTGTAYAYIYQRVFPIDDAYIARESSTVDLNSIPSTIETIKIDTNQAVKILDSTESTRKIEVETLRSDVDLTIENVNLDVKDVTDGIALDFTGTNNILNLMGHSSFTSASSKPGINVEASEVLTISSSTNGSLTTVGSVGSTGGTVNITNGQIYSNAYGATLNISGDSAVFGETDSAFNTISASSHTYVDSDNISSGSAYGYTKFPTSWSGKAYGYIKTPIAVNFYDGATLLRNIKIAEGKKANSADAPQKNGYSSSWYTNSDLSDASQWNFDTDIISIAQDLFVKWTMNTYTIGYTLNGGTNHVENPADYNVHSGIITLQEASRTGYTFNGWYDNAGFTGSAITSLDSSIAENKAYYAKFTANSAAVSFDGNGSTSGATPNDIVSQTDAVITLPSNTGNLANIGFTYGGWSDSPNGSAISGNYTVPAGGVTMYAVWQVDGSVPRYTVTFDTQSGTNVSSQTIPETAFAKKPNDPTKSNVTFGGWYTSSDCNDDDRWNFNTSQIVKNTTLYAKWVPVNSGTSGGSSSSGSTGGSSSGEVTTKTVVVNKFTTDVPKSYIGKDKPFEVTSDEVKVNINGLSLSEYQGGDVEIFIQKINTDYFDLEEIGEIPEGLSVFDISLIVDGIKVPFSNDRPLHIEIKVDGDYENHKLVPVYLGNNGNYEILEGVYDGEKIIFQTTHLSNYALVYVDRTFSDITSHWSKEAIEALASRQVLSGIGDDLFNPNGKITRGEFITIMVNYFDFKLPDESALENLENAWYTRYVVAARRAGILPVIYHSAFDPNEDITREEMMYILYKSLEVSNRLDTLTVNGDSLSDFSDSDLVHGYAIKGSEYLISTDVINGSGGGKFNPTYTSTRAEVAQMIWNMICLMK